MNDGCRLWVLNSNCAERHNTPQLEHSKGEKGGLGTKSTECMEKTVVGETL